MLPPGKTNIDSQRARPADPSRVTTEILEAIAPKESPDSVKIPVALRLGPIALEALGGGEADDERRAAILELAARYYLRDIDSGRSTRPFPEGQKELDSAPEATELELEIDNQVWGSFQQEASRQGVPPAELAVHAIFYLTTDIESGRATERILGSPEFDETRP